jgi:hypothetical protein
MALNPPRHWDFLLLGWSLSFGTPGQISVGAYNPGYVSRMMNMNLLCPELVRRILDDDLDSDFSFSEIYRNIPVLWEDQFKKFKVPMTA